MRAKAALASLFAGTAMTTGPAAAQPTGGWTEAVVSVAAFEPTERVFTRLGGWRMVTEGTVSSAELDYWKLPAAASARFRRICAPQVTVGCIRMVRFSGVPQQPIRPAARAWDTGGIFSLMVRSDNVDQLYRDALTLGWWAESPPIGFRFGASDLKNVVLTGPHGINLAVYQRVSPPFTAFPVGRISQVFNSMRMVKHQPTSKAFFEKLGFKPRFDADAEPLEPSWSNFSIPLNFTPIIRRKAAAMQPHEGEWGRVEVMQIVGFTGRDHSANAVPPNLGIISVRYPVADLASYRQQLERQQVAIPFAARGVNVTALGRVDLMAVRDPDGSLTEFYQVR